MASTEDETAIVLVSAIIHRRKRRKRPKEFWVRPIFRRRVEQGEFRNLLQEMRLSDTESHFKYLRMSREKFDFLLSQIAPMLDRRHYSSSVRPNISPAEKLTVTLRFLATGSSQASLSFAFRISPSSITSIVYDTCKAIWSALQPLYVVAPKCKEDWFQISKEFEQLWNFPHCIGAIDGKHIVIQAPPNAGSSYYNYKGTHSIVLLAVCDARYRFVLVAIGETGRQSDGGIFSNSSFGQALESNSLFIPSPSPLPNDTTINPLPYVIVGDEAFPLKSYLMRPFPGRYLPEDQAIYNYRLSRARRIIENTFGILAARWRIFRTSIIALPHRAEVFTKAAIALHNFLQTSESSSYCPTGFVDGEDGARNLVEGSWREYSSAGLSEISRVGSNRHARTSEDIRNSFKDYFNSTAGEVHWQYAHVRRTNYNVALYTFCLQYTNYSIPYKINSILF